jgi:hypothetical protein
MPNAPSTQRYSAAVASSPLLTEGCHCHSRPFLTPSSSDTPSATAFEGLHENDSYYLCVQCTSRVSGHAELSPCILDIRVLSTLRALQPPSLHPIVSPHFRPGRTPPGRRRTSLTRSRRMPSRRRRSRGMRSACVEMRILQDLDHPNIVHPLFLPSIA